MVVDILGLVFNCWVSAVKAAPVVVVEVLESISRIGKILADQSYRGSLASRIEQGYNCCLELTTKLGFGFVVQPQRWIVERTFAWLENARRLCRDYEQLPDNHEGVVYIVMIRLMLRRLTKNLGSKSTP